MSTHRLSLRVSVLVCLSLAVGCGGGDDGFNPNTGAPPDPPDTTPPANVADLASSTTTTSSVDLTWTAPGDDLTAGTAAEYDIRYSTSVISDANYGSAPQAGSPPAPSAPGTSQTFSISGLDENTTYHFALQTADEVPNWSGLSNVTSATTLSSAPTPPEFVLGWGSSGSGDGQFDGASGIAVDGSGNVYVTDWLNHRVQKFDGEGTFLTKWGTQGSGDGQFEQPQGIAVDGSGNVYVADTENDRVQKFDGEGTFLTKWGIQGSGDGQFVGPAGITVDGGDDVYVVDTKIHRIQKFDGMGMFLVKWGSPGSSDGQFSSPYGVALDGDGNIYVVDVQSDRIQKFR